MHPSRLTAWALLIVTAVVAGAAGAAVPSHVRDSRQTAIAPDVASRTSVTVRRGQNLSGIFAAERIPARDLVLVLKADGDAWRLARLQPGHRIEIGKSAAGRLLQLSLDTRGDHIYRFTRQGRRFTSHRDAVAFERRTASATATIRSSLYGALRRQGLSNRVILNLAGVFEWDVDLARELSSGARVSVVYEQLYKDGRKVRDGAILAAELVNRGRRLRAVRYRDPQGRVAYYAPDGSSMQKAFLRSPLEFSRVTSGFSHTRRHPVLGRMRAHRGVDYAAPSGTPVRATGAGRVRLAARKGGYGRTVVLAHGGRTTTLYAHLLRYAPGIRPGKSVEQGDIIGYVGQSGLATGPHVHYEYRVRGVHQDALRVALPKGEPVALEHRDHFFSQTRDLSQQLTVLSSGLQVADAGAGAAVE